MTALQAPPRSGPPAPTKVALRHRLAERGIDRQLFLLLPAAVFVVTLFIYPFFYGVGLSFQPEEGGPFAAVVVGGFGGRSGRARHS